MAEAFRHDPRVHAGREQMGRMRVAKVVQIRKLAHYVDVPRKAIVDFGNFQEMLRREMFASVVHLENTQIAAGDGQGENLEGLLNSVGILSVAQTGDQTELETILEAVTALRVGSAYAEAGAVVLHPTDDQAVRLTRSDADYLVGAATAGPPNTLWGVARHVTSDLAADTGIVANLGIAADVLVREPLMLFVDPYSQSASNVVRCIAEERIALAVLQPAAVCELTFLAS